METTTTKSTHRIEIVPVTLESHPNADSLSVVKVFGYTVCVRTEDWIGKTSGAYIVPDTLVPIENPIFSFLDKGDPWVRIKVQKLRGIVSMGLLVQTPEGYNIGDDVSGVLGVKRYEPPIQTKGGESVPGPNTVAYKYDVDAFLRYEHVFEEGENVYITEKIHGANARYTFVDGQQFCGSRTQWKKESDGDIWWKAFKHDPTIGDFCEANPGAILYGEVAGNVKGFNYGVDGVKFFAFDILVKGQWLDVDSFLEECIKFSLDAVPVLLYNAPYNKDQLLKLAEERSKLGNHIAEGCVVKPMIERTHPEIGRVCLKIVGNNYYKKAK
jgi:RNA ligase (TIGR02306 family)